MNVNADSLVSIADAAKDFSKAARLVDEKCAAIILKDNIPRYLVVDFSSIGEEALARDEDVLEVSRRLIERNRNAYKALFLRCECQKPHQKSSWGEELFAV